MEMKWPPQGRENCIFNALLTRSEHLSLSGEYMTWHDRRKSRQVNARHLAKHLQVCEGAIRNAAHQDLGYESYGLGVNADADADANVGALQTIVKPWTDSVANGGRIYVFQQNSIPSNKALKTQD
ncbi:hypothetical protein ACTXT7_000152 [Hymenolepis weldensis]